MSSAPKEDEDAQKRIRQMINFILQEAREKADEILLKADEEFQIEKGRILNPERVKLKQDFDRKFKELEIQRKINFSTQVNKSRLQVLEKREKLMEELQEDTDKRLTDLKKDKKAYQGILKNLLIQSLIRIDETDVEVSVVQEDVSDMDAVLKEAVAQYKQIWKEQTGEKSKTNVKLNKNKCLPDGDVGGIVLKARRGKIVLDNTLRSRLNVASAALLPILRGRLFGITPHKGVIYEDELEEQKGDE